LLRFPLPLFFARTSAIAVLSARGYHGLLLKHFCNASVFFFVCACRASLSFHWRQTFMEYEWDEAKRLANLRKHGIDFTDVPAVFDGDIVTVEDDRYGYGEQRFVTFGLLQGRVIAVVHTEREDCTRIKLNGA